MTIGGQLSTDPTLKQVPRSLTFYCVLCSNQTENLVLIRWSVYQCLLPLQISSNIAFSICSSSRTSVICVSRRPLVSFLLCSPSAWCGQLTTVVNPLTKQILTCTESRYFVVEGALLLHLRLQVSAMKSLGCCHSCRSSGHTVLGEIYLEEVMSCKYAGRHDGGHLYGHSVR